MHIALCNVMNDGMYTPVALNKQPSTSVNNFSKFRHRHHLSISFSTRIVVQREESRCLCKLTASSFLLCAKSVSSSEVEEEEEQTWQW